MPVHQTRCSRQLVAIFTASMLGLAGCNKVTAPAETASALAATALPAYVVPGADQLAQLVAPLALFPDKLVAQVLAGSTYPEQVGMAFQWQQRNAALKPADMTAAVDVQRWDVSIKSLTAFPAVLAQLARNLPWTTALGQAYLHDPADVLNAIQLLRQQARERGTLRSSAQLWVGVAPPAQGPDNKVPAGSGPVYPNRPVAPAPGQIITIEPAQPDTVYVPYYDPQTVYGPAVPHSYPGYVDAPPDHTGENNPILITTGVVSFGAAILVGAFLDQTGEHHSRHDRYWQAWNMNWGGPHESHEGGRGQGRPAVTYNSTTYVTQPTTVFNRVTTTNMSSSIVTNNAVTNNTVTSNAVTNNALTSQATTHSSVTNRYGYPVRSVVPGSTPADRPPRPRQAPAPTNNALSAGAGLSVPAASTFLPPPALSMPLRHAYQAADRVMLPAPPTARLSVPPVTSQERFSRSPATSLPTPMPHQRTPFPERATLPPMPVTPHTEVARLTPVPQQVPAPVQSRPAPVPLSVPHDLQQHSTPLPGAVRPILRQEPQPMRPPATAMVPVQRTAPAPALQAPSGARATSRMPGPEHVPDHSQPR